MPTPAASDRTRHQAELDFDLELPTGECVHRRVRAEAGDGQASWADTGTFLAMLMARQARAGNLRVRKAAIIIVDRLGRVRASIVIRIDA